MTEICGDNVDNDCDGQVDEDCCEINIDLNRYSFTLDAGAGETVIIGAGISEASGKPLKWTLTLRGQTFNGTGNSVHVKWNGLDASGKSETKTYPATLRAETTDGECSDEVQFDITVTKSENCKLRVTVGSSANVASGELTDSLPIFSTSGSGPALDLSLHYGSQDGYRGTLGIGWSHSYNIIVTEDVTGEVFLHEGDGGRKLYTPSGSGYLSQPGDYSTLTKNADGTFLLTRKDGTQYRFGSSGQIASIIDRNGNALTFSYVGDLLRTVTDSAGRTVAFTYDDSGKLSSITDPSGNAYGFTVGESLSSATFPDGGSWSYAYDADAFLTAKIDPLGNVTAYTYDDQHRVVESVDPEGRTRTITYSQDDNAARTTTFTEKDGGVWRYTYDTSAGGLLAKTDPGGNTTSYTYDASHNTLSKTDTDDSIIAYTYDAAGNMTSTTDPLGQTTSYMYNAFGQTTSITDPEGNVTRYEYDEKGNLIKTIDPTGAATSYTYDERGNIVSVTDSVGGITRMAYDSVGNLTSVTDPSGAMLRMEYDAGGRMIKQIDAHGGVTTFEYDPRGNLIKTFNPLGNATTTIFDGNGNKTAETDANGNTTRYEYNAQGQMVKMTNALGNDTTFTYGGAGCASCGGGADKLTSLTDAKGQTTTFEYDSLGRMVKETDPLGNETRYGYDAKGNLIAKTDGNGNLIRYSYDTLGRLLKKCYPDTSEETFTYDAKGNLLTALNANFGYTFTYDAVGRVTSVTDSEGRVISYEYDNAGRKTKLVAPDGKMLRYEYDVAGRLTALRNGGDFLFSYDKLGRRSMLTYPNGVVASYSYDSAGRLTSLLHRNAAGDVITSNSYTHDRAGNRLTNATQDRALSYKYDAIYRLTQALSRSPGYSSNAKGKGGGIDNATQQQKELYVYDAVGNRLQTDKISAYEYNAGNAMLKAGGTYFRYDRNGNMIEKVSAEGVTTYDWDYENRLTKVNTPAGTMVEFKYDSFSRRIEKKVSDAEGVKVTRFVYDSEDILFETDETGTTGNRYIHGPGIDEPLALVQGKDTYYYHADGLGCIVALTDKAGRAVQDYQYDSFGNLKDMKNRIKQPFTFTGREWDREIGLLFERNRYYDPMEGRYISKDPISFRGGDVNLYRRVRNNPINLIDPFGLAGLWLEASSPREPGPHQSVGFGDPNGANFTLSFGVNPGESPFGGMGSVYQDVNAGGEIEEYYDVPSSLELLIEAELIAMHGNRDVYFLESNNCRHWSNDTIDSLVKKYNLQKITPPNRKATPTGSYPGGTSSQPTTNTGVWTSSPGPTM